MQTGTGVHVEAIVSVSVFHVCLCVFTLPFLPVVFTGCYHSFPLVSYIIFFFAFFLFLSSLLFLNWQTCEHVKTCSVLSYNPLTLTLAMFRTGECWIMDI